MPEDCGTCHSGSTELKGKIMGIKIKKEPKFEAQKLKPLKENLSVLIVQQI